MLESSVSSNSSRVTENICSHIASSIRSLLGRGLFFHGSNLFLFSRVVVNSSELESEMTKLSVLSYRESCWHRNQKTAVDLWICFQHGFLSSLQKFSHLFVGPTKKPQPSLTSSRSIPSSGTSEINLPPQDHCLFWFSRSKISGFRDDHAGKQTSISATICTGNNQPNQP